MPTPFRGSGHYIYIMGIIPLSRFRDYSIAPMEKYDNRFFRLSFLRLSKSGVAVVHREIRLAWHEEIGAQALVTLG